MPEPLRVLTLAAEAEPFIKVGGLGDVAGSLPAALRRLPEAVDIRLALPFYPQIDTFPYTLEPLLTFRVPHEQGPIPCEVFQTTEKGVVVYLLKGGPIHASPAIYERDDSHNSFKFTFFSLAALELARHLNWQPHVVHAHDWHTSPAVYKLHLTENQDGFFDNTGTLLTVHNLPYLGDSSALSDFGLPPAEDSPLPDWAQNLPLPLGLFSADKINTVSDGYAKEIMTPEYGAGLDPFLRARREDITGILNGIDTQTWDPEHDVYLPLPYDIDQIHRRRKNKIQLLHEVGLGINPEIPLIGTISRLNRQKGVDLLPGALRLVSDLPWQAILLGTGDPGLERELQGLDGTLPQVRANISYDGELAHRIYGGADMLLIPSRYEPCGLTQMIAMRYGCVPVARATGGLRDTIIDYHGETPQSRPRASTGFLFDRIHPNALAEGIRRALDVYEDDRSWLGLQQRGMKMDFSWTRSAEKYLKLYQEINAPTR